MTFDSQEKGDVKGLLKENNFLRPSKQILRHHKMTK